MAPAIHYKQIIVNQMTQLNDHNEKDIFFLMRSYRTEGDHNFGNKFRKYY